MDNPGYPPHIRSLTYSHLRRLYHVRKYSQVPGVRTRMFWGSNIQPTMRWFRLMQWVSEEPGEKFNGLEAAVWSKEDTHFYMLKVKERTQAPFERDRGEAVASGNHQVSTGARKWREFSEKRFKIEVLLIIYLER